MENISPVIFFIIYLALSAWAKNRKAQAKKAPPPPPPVEREGEVEEVPQKGFGVGSIFEQIKQELLDLQEEAKIPIPVAPVEEMSIPEPVEIPPAPFVKTSPVVEGSSALEDHQVTMQQMAINQSPEDKSAESSLSAILDGYSRLEQGIILKEVLGKPRSMQDQDKWFHTH